MKKRILVAALQLFLILNSCSSDSGSDPVPTPTPPIVLVKTAKITSYSKNAGETGETVTMYGENFSDKVSDIKITFNGVATSIVSATANEIKFKLPQSEKVLPKLEITIENRTVINEVKNNYNGNIGILPTPSTTDWFTVENTLIDGKIGRIQILSDKIMYFSVENAVYRTLDGGITWSLWVVQFFNTGFHLTTNNEGWVYALGNGAGVVSMPFQEIPMVSSNFKYIWKESASPYETIYSIYVDDNMKNGTIVSQAGKAYTSTNGLDFAKVYEVAGDETPNLYQSTEIDNDHIWAIGYKSILSNGYKANRPFILFKNNTTDGWKEYPFINEEGGYYAREICFVDKENGFLLVNHYYQSLLDVKLFKTNNGGDSWTPIYDGEMFSKFAFKDVNTGWAILENKIYKTIDGGLAWTLDYTHDQPIKNIAYKNNVVWAISKDKIIKRYL